MNNLSIVTVSNDTYLYNKTNDTYEYHCSGTKFDWIFVSNNKLMSRLYPQSNEISELNNNIKTNNKFKHLEKSDYDQCIIYYEDDNYKIATKESKYIFVFDMHNNKDYYFTNTNGDNVIQFDEITKISDDKYFMHNSLNIGTCIQITQDKNKKGGVQQFMFKM